MAFFNKRSEEIDSLKFDLFKSTLHNIWQDEQIDRLESENKKLKAQIDNQKRIEFATSFHNYIAEKITSTDIMDSLESVIMLFKQTKPHCECAKENGESKDYILCDDLPLKKEFIDLWGNDAHFRDFIIGCARLARSGKTNIEIAELMGNNWQRFRKEIVGETTRKIQRPQIVNEAIGEVKTPGRPLAKTPTGLRFERYPADSDPEELRKTLNENDVFPLVNIPSAFHAVQYALNQYQNIEKMPEEIDREVIQILVNSQIIPVIDKKQANNILWDAPTNTMPSGKIFVDAGKAGKALNAVELIYTIPDQCDTK